MISRVRHEPVIVRASDPDPTAPALAKCLEDLPGGLDGIVRQAQ